MIVEFPNGVVVQGTGIDRAGDPDPDFGLYLDRAWRHRRVPWQHQILEWPDFGVPLHLETARAAIRDAYERAAAGSRLEVGCLGGIGRTGTVLGCMAVLSGVQAAEARQWVRDHYDWRAIETEEQHRLVLEFG